MTESERSVPTCETCWSILRLQLSYCPHLKSHTTLCMQPLCVRQWVWIPPAPPPRPLVLICLTGRILLLDDSESLDATVTTVVYIFHASPSDHGSPMRAGGPLVSHMFEKYSVYMQGEKENFETHRPHWSEETLNKRKQLESCCLFVFFLPDACVFAHIIYDVGRWSLFAFHSARYTF